MTRDRIVIAAFVMLALAQLAVPASMILRREKVLDAGVVVRFRTAPVDPVDAFRGRYVALAVEGVRPVVPEGAIVEAGDAVYVVVEEGEDGFALLARVSHEPPTESLYFRASVKYPEITADGAVVAVVELPFDRYYMNEELAPAAEQAYREHSRRSRQSAHITVRLHDGMAVLEELYLDGVPIAEYLGDSG